MQFVHLVLVVSSLFIACNSSFAQHADDTRMSLVQPMGTELKLNQLRLSDGVEATFGGQVWISGTFFGRWPAGTSAAGYKSLEYILVPDERSIARLPYFVLREPPYFNEYKVRTIELENGAAALRLAISEIDAALLLNRKIDSVRATGMFLVTAYVVGVECDSPWSRAVLLKAEIPEQTALAHRKVPEGC